MSVLLVVSLSVAYLLFHRVSDYAHPDGRAPKGQVTVSATAPEAGLRSGPALLNYHGPVGVLHSSGDLHSVGAQHGRLLGRDIGKIYDEQNASQSAARVIARYAGLEPL